MKLTAFQSDKGDCLLVESAGGTVILVDGGMARSYSRHVAPALGKLRSKKRVLDLIIVSHIDEDHIAGIVQLVDDEVDWRVYDYQKKRKNPNLSKFRPENPRPPAVKELWHNAFRDQIPIERAELEDLLIAAMRTSLLDPSLADRFARIAGLVTGERQALQLMHRLSADQLGVPVNSPSSGRLLFIGDGATVRASEAIERGDLRIRILGPRREELEALRLEWEDWIRNNQAAILRIREQARVEAERIHADEAASFRSVLGNLADRLGDRSKVTVPNLASLMVVVNENEKSILLTGDGHAEDIRAGLALDGALDAEGRCHFDVVKVQHHGSENNIDPEFCRKITARHYVFCGDGAHDNPDLEAVDTLIRERLAVAPSRGPFKLWFNSSEKVTPDSRKNHMRELEKLVADRARGHGAAMKFRFLKSGSKLAFSV